MAKRKTKAQREGEQREALLRRLLDMYGGANHGKVDPCDDVLADALAVVIPLIRDTFGEPSKDWFGFRVHCVGHFATAQRACDFLFEHGFRADEGWVEEAGEVGGG